MADNPYPQSHELASLRAEAVRLLAVGDAQGLATVYHKILAINVDDADAINGLGVLDYLSQRWSQAGEHFQRAVALAPEQAQYHLNLAKVWAEEKRHAEVEHLCRTALKLDPGLHDARRQLSVALINLFKNDEALSQVNQVIAAVPDWPDALFLKGLILNAYRKYDEALPLFSRITELQPTNAKAWFAVALNCFEDELRSSQGISAMSRALKLAPDNADYYANYGHTLNSWALYELAGEAFYKACLLRPDQQFAIGYAIYNWMSVGNWKHLDVFLKTAHQRLSHGEKIWEPFCFKALAHSEQDQQLCARIYSAEKFPRVPGVVNVPARLPRSKIRIGYLAGELREHATSILMTGVFESHDRERFEVYAFDNGWDDGGELRRRQNAAFHKIINISKVGDLEAARIIAENEIDILIDLNGFFGAGRQEVFAFKLSPVQVSYLGCPGTMGTDYFDYLIADGVVIPEGSDSYYDEKIVRLPHTYQANDFKRKVSERVFTRAEMGLPEQGFVFCCFNNNYKITPETFSRWMHILQKVEGSVLWLFVINKYTMLNLRREAEKRGVDPDRLIFAQPLPSPEHLARHRLADLFLDTLPYNAHTTASDALWMGLPLVTQVGTTFPGRVAASLLTALGVPELITRTPEAYEALAIELALAPAKLKAVREKIISQRATAPLFNTKLFTQHFEQALQAMYERHQSGLPPAAITIQK